MHICPENRAQMTDPKLIRNYIQGGNGVLTLESPSGKHHSYCYKKPKEALLFPNDVVFVYALHESNKLFYVGMIENGSFRLTHASRFLPDTEIVRGAKFIQAMSHHQLKTPMKLYHEGVCCRCGRVLTNPNSIKEGIGKRCKSKLLESLNSNYEL